jgi:hypothetical protein
MQKRYVRDLQTNWATWRKPKSEDLAATRRRQLMAGWLDEVMGELMEPNNAEFILRSFSATGVLIRRDGTNSIKMRGGDKYTFP